jgi:hypothetical protein
MNAALVVRVPTVFSRRAIVETRGQKKLASLFETRLDRALAHCVDARGH